jgi:hypothetical protein
MKMTKPFQFTAHEYTPYIAHLIFSRGDNPQYAYNSKAPGPNIPSICLDNSADRGDTRGLVPRVSLWVLSWLHQPPPLLATENASAALWPGDWTRRNLKIHLTCRHQTAGAFPMTLKRASLLSLLLNEAHQHRLRWLPWTRYMISRAPPRGPTQISLTPGRALTIQTERPESNREDIYGKGKTEPIFRLKELGPRTRLRLLKVIYCVSY